MSKAETDEKALPEKILTDTTDNRLQITGEAPLNSPYQETAAKASIIPPNDEGKFFSHDQWSDGPEVVKELSPLYSITPGLPTSVSHSPSDPTLEVASNLEPVKRKFGLRRRVFWGLVLIAVIILGAAVGGGIGGGLASKYRSEKARETILFTMASPPSNTALMQPPPSFLVPPPTNLPPGTQRMGFSMQIWEKPQYQGRSQVFYTPGYFRTAFLARSYMWHPSQYTDAMEKCSMAFCLDDFEIGWRGATTTEKQGFPSNSSWGANSVVIICAANFASPGCPGLSANSLMFSTAPVITVLGLTATAATAAAATATAASGSGRVSSASSGRVSSSGTLRSRTSSRTSSVTTSSG